MKIDIMCSTGKTPIIVGDEADMANLVTLDRPPFTDNLLVFRNAEGDPVRLEVSDRALEHLSEATHMCFVTLSPDDNIGHARLLDIGNCTGRSLAEHEVQKLAQDLVSGDFHMACLN